MTACCSSGTFLARRSLVSLCVASILGAAAFVGGGTDGAGKSARALDPGLLFPSGTMMTISFDGKPVQEHGKDLAVSRILNEPEMKEFLKEALALLDERVGNAGKAFLKDLGLEDKDFDALAGARISIAVTRFEFGEQGFEGEPSFDLMLAAEMRGGQKAVESLLKALESMVAGPDGLKESTVGGVPAKTIPVPPGGPFSGVTYVVHEGWLIAGTSTAQLEGALARAKSGDSKGSALADPTYAAGMKEVLRPKTVASMYLDYGRALTLAAETDPMVKQVIGASGLTSLTGFAYGLDLDGTSVRERLYQGIKPGSPMAALWSPFDASTILSRVPKRSVAAYAASLDLKKYVDFILGMVKNLPGGEEEIDQALAEVDRVLGANWRQDLLPNLGPEIAAFVAMPKFGFVPEVGFLLKVGDRAKVEGAIAKIFASRENVLRKQTFLDNTITTIDCGAMKIDKDFNLRPAYAFVGDYLLVTPSPHTTKSLLISMNNKDGGLAGQETYTAALGRLKAENPSAGNLGVAYVDFAWVAGFLFENAVPIVQSAVREKDLAQMEREAGFRLDLAKIPSTDTVVKHLSPIIMAWQSKEGGVLADIVSPVSMVGTFTLAGAAGAALGVRKYESLEVGAEPAEHDRAKPRRRAAASRPGKDRDEDK
jgi:hypothetical protein